LNDGRGEGRKTYTFTDLVINIRYLSFTVLLKSRSSVWLLLGCTCSTAISKHLYTWCLCSSNVQDFLQTWYAKYFTL